MAEDGAQHLVTGGGAAGGRREVVGGDPAGDAHQRDRAVGEAAVGRGEHPQAPLLGREPEAADVGRRRGSRQARPRCMASVSTGTPQGSAIPTRTLRGPA